MKPEAGKRSELMVRKEKELLKGVLTPYKLAPVTKKVEVAGKKVMVEQKAVKRQAKIEEKSAVMYRKVIKGGTVDIRKFPYEWYLRSMEDKIYRNWDTLSTNFFIDRPLNVTVYFVVDRKGMVGEVYVEESSLNDAVDISAMEAVKLSSPLPPLPAGYEEDILEVHFGFRLEAFR
jgi:TonB family protein